MPKKSAPADPSMDESAATELLQAANPLAGMTIRQAAVAGTRWGLAVGRHPTVLAAELAKWAGEQAKVLAGTSDVEPGSGDKRFADDAWRGGLWQRLAQSYLVSRSSMLDSIENLDMDDGTAERTRFALTQFTEALAPTNVLLGNPAALRRAWHTRGRSLVDGARHLAHDVRHNRGMPSQVDTRPFRVGETIAVTPGSVVLRTPMFELIQYTPTTPKVRTLPTVIIPPQINRFYFLDLAPERSFVEYALSRGIQTFMVSWRNPGPDQRDWGLDDYAQAIIEALRAAAAIAGTDQVNPAGFCAGGMTLSTVLAHLTEAGDDLVNVATLAVTLIDTEVDSSLSAFADERLVQTAIRRSRRKGVLDGKALARVFAMVRPNDLVWNYWVSNYLMGHNPPAFDVLAWNNDATNLPATLHAEFLHLWTDNALMKAGTLEVLGTKVDLGTVTTELYALGALTDHLVRWESAYAATQTFGSDVRFVLSNSGHIQALVNPPDNEKASFLDGDATPADPSEWKDAATNHDGSWWVDWADWTVERSGALRAKPKEPGNDDHPVLDPAPGRYVHE